MASEARRAYMKHLDDERLLVDDLIHTPAALKTVRDVLPDDAIVTTDVGGFDC